MAYEPERKLVLSWLAKAFQTDRVDVKIINKSGGYVGDIIFAKARINNEDQHLAIKVGKNDADSRRLMPIQEAGRREIHFYNEILPNFNKLQIQNNIQDVFNAVPKCYGAFQSQDTEVIILEDLVKKGYELHKSYEPLNVYHLKLGLKNFAKFHALSFALRDHNQEVFKRLTENSGHIFKSSVPVMKDIYSGYIKKVVNQLEEAGQFELSRKYENFVKKGAGNIFLEIYDSPPKESVVTHCDCHNNNFFFKYEGHHKESPLKMKIIDYQISCLHSPILDISYFWYTGASTNEMPHFDHLIEYYHQELSNFLYQLGSDPNEIFPLSKLWEHWVKYSKFGFMMSSLYMDVLLYEKEEKALEMDFKENIMHKNYLRSSYTERLVAVIEHYFKVHERCI